MWTFIQDQILGMKWLNTIIGKLLLMVGLDVNSRVGGSIQFFIYDTIKITVLLKMYDGGGDFTNNIDKMGGEGTAEFIFRAIKIYCGR